MSCPSSESDVQEQVKEIDDQINAIRYRIALTEDQIQQLVELNYGRRKRLKSLGEERSRILTYELNFNLPQELPAS